MDERYHQIMLIVLRSTFAAVLLVCPALLAQATWDSAAPAAKSATAAAPVGAPAAVGNPFEQIARDTFAGRYFSEEVRMHIEKSADGFSGAIRFKGQTLPLEGKLKEGKLEGTFGEGAERWPFEAQVDGDKLTYTAGEFKATLTRCRLPELKGAYESKTTRIEFLNRDGAINGTIRIGGQPYDFSGTAIGGELNGEFRKDGKAFAFCLFKDADLIKDPDKISLESASFRDVLERDRSDEIRLAKERLAAAEKADLEAKEKAAAEKREAQRIAEEKAKADHDARLKACEEALNDATSRKKVAEEKLAARLAEFDKVMRPVFDKAPLNYEGKYWSVGDNSGLSGVRDTVTLARQTDSLRIGFHSIMRKTVIGEIVDGGQAGAGFELTRVADPVKPVDIQRIACTPAEGNRKKVVISFRRDVCREVLSSSAPTMKRSMEFEVEKELFPLFDGMQSVTEAAAPQIAPLEKELEQCNKDVVSAQAALDLAQGKTPAAPTVAPETKKLSPSQATNVDPFLTR